MRTKVLQGAGAAVPPSKTRTSQVPRTSAFFTEAGPCRTAVRPLSANRVLRRAQVGHWSTKIGIADHSIGDRPGGAPAPNRALGK